MMIMKGERPLDWALWVDAESELADLESVKHQEIKLMKFCQVVKSKDRLYKKNHGNGPQRLGTSKGDH